MKLSLGQLEKLSELFIDLAKGLLLGAFAVPVLAKESTLIEPLRAILAGLFFAYLSLKIEALRETKK